MFGSETKVGLVKFQFSMLLLSLIRVPLRAHIIMICTNVTCTIQVF